MLFGARLPEIEPWLHHIVTNDLASIMVSLCFTHKMGIIVTSL
jgi:hypothetical protein